MNLVIICSWLGLKDTTDNLVVNTKEIPSRGRHTHESWWEWLHQTRQNLPCQLFYSDVVSAY